MHNTTKIAINLSNDMQFSFTSKFTVNADFEYRLLFQSGQNSQRYIVLWTVITMHNTINDR